MNFVGVTHLHLGNTRDFINISQPLTNPFPNVAHLTFKNPRATNYDATAKLANMIESLATWKLLTRLDILIKNQKLELSQILKALESLDLTGKQIRRKFVKLLRYLATAVFLRHKVPS